MLVFGIIEFGMLFRADLTVSQAARSGRPHRGGPAPGHRLPAQRRQRGGRLTAEHLGHRRDHLPHRSTRPTRPPGCPLDGGTYKTCTDLLPLHLGPDRQRRGPSCGGSAWLPTAQKACGSEALTDYIGVYVEADYKWVTGFFTPDVRFDSPPSKERTVMRLEPIGSQTACS